MKKLCRIFILLLFLIILSLSTVNASELENDIQDNGIVNLEINENNPQNNFIVDAGIDGNSIQDSKDEISLNDNLDNNLGSNNNLKNNLESNNDLESKNDLGSKNNLDNNLESVNNLDHNLDSNKNLKNDLESKDINLDSNFVSDDELIVSEFEDEESLQYGFDIDSNTGNTLKSDLSTVHQVSPTTYSHYFSNNGYVITTVVSPGDTIDLSGRFSRKNFIFTIPCSITSSQCDAYLTNCMVKFENVTSSESSPSCVSNLNFNTSIESTSCVHIYGSSYIDVSNCNAYSTGASSNPTFLHGATYCNIHDNVFETTFEGYMNMSWKRAGILLGESHYNNIYSNHVTVKDSNPIYLTTYGYEKSNYNVIFNNTVSTSAFSNETGLRNPSAWAYGVHVMGDHNLILNNTIMNTYRGVDSEGSFNEIIGNRIFNLSGSYYEGNNGTDGGEGGIFASYDNLVINNTIYDSKITGPAIYAVVNTTVYGNTVYNITGPNGIQFALSASNCLIDNNSINMNTGNAIYVKGNMTNLTISNNVLSTDNGTAILIQKQTRAKYPADVTILNNLFLENSNDYINYSDVEGKTVVILQNNSVVLTNQTFFRFFDSDGALVSNSLFENFIFKGEFSDLGAGESGDLKVSTICLNGKVTIIGDNAYIKDISFNINSSNVRIDNVFVNITDAIANTFNFNNAINCTLANSIIYFNSTNENFIPIFGNGSGMSLTNNTIIVYSDNIALALNNTNCSLLDNCFNSSSLNHVTILNDNDSYLFFGENLIDALVEPAVVSINGAIIKYTYIVIEDYNYHEYFNPDGTFLEDVIFNFGDTIRIGNVNNKTFRFDIPLVIIGDAGYVMNNSFIILEGESSNSVVSNFTFYVDAYESSGDISIITVKDGVSDLKISNNDFSVINLNNDHALNVINVVLSDVVSSNILMENNNIDIDSNLSQVNGILVRKDALSLYNEIAENVSIRNNTISIINHRVDGTANGINILSSMNSFIFDNSIFVRSYSANGISAVKSNLTIRDNDIAVEGLNYERIMDYIDDNSLKDLIEDNRIRADSAISTDRDTCLNDDVADCNILVENNALTHIIHLSNSFKDLENIIENAKNGSLLDLGNNIYIISDSIDINKTIALTNGILISNLREDNVLFNVLSNSSDSFNVSSSSVILDNSNVFISLNSLDDNNPYFIDVSSLNISNNEFLAIDNQIVFESTVLLKIESYKNVLNPNTHISIEDNQIPCGMKTVKFDIKTVVNGSDVFIPSNISLYQKTPSVIVYSDMVTTAVDTTTDGRVGEYFNISLMDNKGNPLANRYVQIGFNGKIYNKTTDSNGNCSLQINLGREGTYTFAVSFLGDEDYAASFVVAKVTVKKQNPVISCTNCYFKATAKNKKISVSLKSASRKPLKNKTIKLTVNGKTYSAKTNSNGVATINVSLSTKKTYSYTVKYAGDKMYSAVSKTAKITIS